MPKITVSLHGGSLVRVGSSAGALAFDVIRASLESRPLQEKLGLLVPWAQRELVTNYQE